MADIDALGTEVVERAVVGAGDVGQVVGLEVLEAGGVGAGGGMMLPANWWQVLGSKMRAAIGGAERGDGP